MRPSISGRLGKTVRRRPLLSSLLGLFILTVALPVEPARPYCWEGGEPRMIWDRLDSTFLALYKRHLALFGVYYWDIDGLILVHWWPSWLDLFWDRPPGEMDAGDAISNAHYKSMAYLLEGVYDGRVIAGELYLPSDEMIRLRAEIADEEHFSRFDDCWVMYRLVVVPD